MNTNEMSFNRFNQLPLQKYTHRTNGVYSILCVLFAQLHVLHRNRVPMRTLDTSIILHYIRAYRDGHRLLSIRCRLFKHLYSVAHLIALMLVSCNFYTISNANNQIEGWTNDGIVRQIAIFSFRIVLIHAHCVYLYFSIENVLFPCKFDTSFAHVLYKLEHSYIIYYWCVFMFI